MGVYSRRLVGPIITPAASTVLYTVPAGYVAIIRTIVIMNANTANPCTHSIGIGPLATNLLFHYRALAAAGMVIDDMRIPLNAGDTIKANRAGTGLPVLTIGGYLMEA